MSHLSMPSILLVGRPKIGKSSEVIRAFGRKAVYLCADAHALAPARDAGRDPSQLTAAYLLAVERPMEGEALPAVRKAVEMIRAGTHTAVVVDTLTLLAEREYDWIVESGEESEGYGKAARLVARRVSRLINTVIAGGGIFVAVAHEREPTIIEGKQTPGGPKIPGRDLVKSLPSMFTMTLRCAVQVSPEGDKRRVFRCNPLDQDYLSGDSSGVVVDGEPMDLRGVIARYVEKMGGGR